eukprot:COSAG04_NODE_4237_length_2213_cov_3.134816_1_plen_90_part_10
MTASADDPARGVVSSLALVRRRERGERGVPATVVREREEEERGGGGGPPTPPPGGTTTEVGPPPRGPLLPEQNHPLPPLITPKQPHLRLR